MISRRTGLAKVEGRYSVNPDTGCWLWQHYTDQYGYGIFNDYDAQTKRSRGCIRAHRYTYSVVHGPIPEGMCVLHKCDVPNCINPEHLFLGTQADNNADMCRKKRNSGCKGSEVRNAKLTESAVREIRQNLAGKLTPAEIAANFNVTRATIYGILHRRSWNHV